MRRSAAVLALALVVTTSLGHAHELLGPEEVVAAPDESFEFDVTYIGPDFDFRFGSIFTAGIENVTTSSSWYDGFCELAPAGTSITVTIEGSLVDADFDGTTYYEVGICESGYPDIVLFTTIHPYDPLPIDAVSWAELKAVFE